MPYPRFTRDPESKPNAAGPEFQADAIDFSAHYTIDPVLERQHRVIRVVRCAGEWELV